MINIKSYEDIIKIWRQIIIEQGELSKNLVLNSESVRGADLQKIINKINVKSLNLSDVCIISELLEDNNGNNYIVNEDDNTMSSISSYQFVLHIYGNASHTCAQILMARIKTEDVATSLHEKGIYLSGIEYPENTKEFINNTLWPRCDLKINFQVRYNIENLRKSEYFDYDISKITINVKTFN